VLSSGKQPVRTATSPTRSGATRYSSFSSLLIATISPAHHACHSIIQEKKRTKALRRWAIITGASVCPAEVNHSVSHAYSVSQLSVTAQMQLTSVMLPVSITLQVLTGQNLAVGGTKSSQKGGNVNSMITKQTGITFS